MIKIATWNVNSIRARLPRIIEWFKEENPDIILLQELKCTEEQFPFFEFVTEFNYNIEMVCEKARNGVAILSKFPLYNIQKNLPLYNIIEKDESARYNTRNVLTSKEKQAQSDEISDWNKYRRYFRKNKYNHWEMTPAGRKLASQYSEVYTPEFGYTKS